MVVLSNNDKIFNISLQVMLQYLLDYPLGKKLRNHLEFLVSQLEFEYESGRESAMEMMATIFSAFPQVW